MKLKGYSVVNTVWYIVRLLMILGLVFQVKLLAIIPLIIAVINVITGFTDVVKISKETALASALIDVITALTIICINSLIVRGILILFQVVDIVAIFYAQLNSKQYGEIVEDLQGGNF